LVSNKKPDLKSSESKTRLEELQVSPQVSWFFELQKDVALQTKSHGYGPLKTSEQKWRNMIDPLRKSSVNQKKPKRNVLYS